jgi:hypothetical protein
MPLGQKVIMESLSFLLLMRQLSLNFALLVKTMNLALKQQALEHQ